MFLTGPAIVRRSPARRGHGLPGRAARARAKRGLPLHGANRCRRRADGAGAARLPAPARRRIAAAMAGVAPPGLSPATRCPRRRARSMTYARWSRPGRRRTPDGGQPALVAQRRLRARSPGGSRDRDHRQPAQVSRGRARRERRAEGSALRAHVQLVRAAAARARRHAGLSAGIAPGARRRDPPRRQARPRVRRGDRAERDASSCARPSAARSSR